VQKGHACAYRQYVKDKQYCLWEVDARSARLGLWGGAAEGVAGTVGVAAVQAQKQTGIHRLQRGDRRELRRRDREEGVPSDEACAAAVALRPVCGEFRVRQRPVTDTSRGSETATDTH
jgi:hypothetical protein